MKRHSGPVPVLTLPRRHAPAHVAPPPPHAACGRLRGVKALVCSAALLVAMTAYGQPPALYIHFVSHNEPNDNLQTALNYARAKNNLLQMAGIVDSKNVRWNLQTSDGLVLGALNDQAATATNIFRTLASAPYNDNIEIDPRYKNSGGRNIADQWYLLDSLGAKPTTTLGGFLYYTANPAAAPVDWEPYRQPVTGNIYRNTWQCTILSGAGSYPPHTNDLNDFGIFKPDKASNFYQHNPAQNLWCVGTGCAPVLDSLSDEQAIIELIQSQVDNIQTGRWPANKFYYTRIMTNQREYGPLFFSKVRKVIDSLALIPADRLKWATIREAFSDFQAWQAKSGLDHSQWLCGQTATATKDPEPENPGFRVFPNPASGNLTIRFSDDRDHEVTLHDGTGRQVLSLHVRGEKAASLFDLPKGIYLIRADRNRAARFVKE